MWIKFNLRRQNHKQQFPTGLVIKNNFIFKISFKSQIMNEQKIEHDIL